MIFSNRQTTISSERGFTLIEVLLASFIFMSVITIAIGSFTSQIALQSGSEAQRDVQQTAQAIVEAISRDFRTLDEEFTITGACSGSTLTSTVCGNTLEFDPSNARGNQKKYWFRPAQQDIRVCDSGCSVNNGLTDAEKINVTQFQVEGIVPAVPKTNQRTQPFVVMTLTLETETNNSGRQEEFASIKVRTLVTSRLFDKYRGAPAEGLPPEPEP